MYCIPAGGAVHVYCSRMHQCQCSPVFLLSRYSHTDSVADQSVRCATPLNSSSPLDSFNHVINYLQGLVDSDGAVMLVEPRHLDQLLHPMFENEKAYQRDVITKGLGASPGAAVGQLVFTAGARACVYVYVHVYVYVLPCGSHLQCSSYRMQGIGMMGRWVGMWAGRQAHPLSLYYLLMSHGRCHP